MICVIGRPEKIKQFIYIYIGEHNSNPEDMKSDMRYWKT